MKLNIRTISLATLLASFMSALYAQDSQISGRILDPSQAAITAAIATLIRTDTGHFRRRRVLHVPASAAWYLRPHGAKGRL
jgi:nanoRNase/pAp phosphatase (c-di-AMP/oligoRNAs hydrolase)